MTGYRCASLDGTAYLAPDGKDTPNANEARIFTSAFDVAVAILDTGRDPKLWDWQPVTVAACTKCSKHPAKPLHVCPYQADVHDDPSVECDCCDECVQNCKDDI